MNELVMQTLYCFVALFVIIDPFIGLAVFMAITKKMKRKEKLKQACIASGVALLLLLVFLFTGLFIVNLLGISFASFMVAGGVILLVMGTSAVLGLEFTKSNSDVNAAAVIVATPIITGPGAMTTVVVLSQKYGYLPPLIASVLVIGITFAMLAYADKLHKLMGNRIVEILSRILGLFLVAAAAELIKNGITQMIHEFKF